MNARIFAVAAAVVAVAAPTGAAGAAVPGAMHVKLPVAGTKPLKQVVTKKTAKPHVPKPAVEKRVLCICIIDVGPPPVPMSREEFERQYDLEMVAHGLEPVYGTITTTAPEAGAAEPT